MFHPRLILHPTDFSDRAHYAFHVAADLAELNQAQLLILHVVETLGPENVTFGEVAAQLQPEGYEQRLSRDLKQRVPPPGRGVAVEYLVVQGDPAEAIDRVARERRCDLIVLGTHGRTGLARLFMGSIAEQVVRQATCPVLVCKVPLAQPGSSSH
jgi:nucleotide-binding universal stress UspA family protein